MTFDWISKQSFLNGFQLSFIESLLLTGFQGSLIDLRAIILNWVSITSKRLHLTGSNVL